MLAMDASNAIVPVSVQCPYCGESFNTLVDLSAGSQHYIEDCYVCCQPIECSVTLNQNGELDAFSARRDND
jgi:transcription elongation factor Elf1